MHNHQWPNSSSVLQLNETKHFNRKQRYEVYERSWSSWIAEKELLFEPKNWFTTIQVMVNEIIVDIESWRSPQDSFKACMPLSEGWKKMSALFRQTIPVGRSSVRPDRYWHIVCRLRSFGLCYSLFLLKSSTKLLRTYSGWFGWHPCWP